MIITTKRGELQMDRQAIASRLIELPIEIEDIETEIYEAQREVVEAKNDLDSKATELQLEGKIDGKNAEVRAAQIKSMTEGERQELVNAENKLALLRVHYNRASNQFKAYQAVARILGEAN